MLEACNDGVNCPWATKGASAAAVTAAAIRLAAITTWNRPTAAS